MFAKGVIEGLFKHQVADQSSSFSIPTEVVDIPQTTDESGALIFAPEETSTGTGTTPVSRETVQETSSNPFEQELQTPPQPDENEIEKMPPEALSNSAQNRFRTLANSRREALNQNAALQEQMRQAQYEAQQVRAEAQRQVEQTRIENIKYQAQLAALQAVGQRQVAEELSPGERLKSEWLGEGKRLFEQQTAPLHQELQSLKAELAHERSQAQVNATAKQYHEDALHIARTVTLRGLPEDTVKSMEHGIANQILATALSQKNGDFKDIGEFLRQAHLRFGAEYYKAKMGQAGTKNKQAVAAPPAMPNTTGKVGSTTNEVSLEQVQAAGFKDILAWQLRNSPPLR